MANEKTLILVKPDGVQRGIAGQVIGRLEATGLRISGMKLLQISDELAAEHYGEHVGKPFYSGLVTFITSGPVVAICLDGPGAISIARKVMGSTNPAEAAPGTIRGDLAVEIGRNVIHGSANEEDAAREVALYFSEDELVDYTRAIDDWLIE
ncbi:MAG TPA: nucleoside-diphosphate kinase [Dehalococcoidia bacterium]|jgi:nucleoside-diphosphate kinase|nr:nucleoside-diphosphate kinase [Dehalococcoidia bacterium]MDP6273194.1 nucleoside-diphosphate kinase [Dehalococcoidia bacterium]MDP7214060.1 nucleoside-diphosphate kinase [Dehalococcoidia bacterium]HJM52796.1 nucleoside-diphosphate kinase [Dehalococcoidia bacterium]